MPSQPEAIDRRELREFLDSRRKYWETADKSRPSTGGIADSVLEFLVEKGITVKDSDWSY